MNQFEINDKNEGQRLDKFLQRLLKNAGAPFVYKMLRKKNITLNDRKADGNVILKAGDVVKLYFSDETYEKFAGENAGGDKGDGEGSSGRDSGVSDEKDIKGSYKSIKGNKRLGDLEFYKGTDGRISFKSSIIYEDDNVILINKPAGILSQKAKPDDISLNEYIIYYLYSENKITDDDLNLYKPSVVNRLDRNTSGITIAAKNLKAAVLISKGLKDRTINKYYKCAVAGSFNKEGLHRGYLLKDSLHNIVTVLEEKGEGASFIETEYELISDNGDYSILSVHLLTGRAHQIRAHLAYLGFPVIGDRKYGDAEVNRRYNKKFQMLHAYKIEFPEFTDKCLKKIAGKMFISDIEITL